MAKRAMSCEHKQYKIGVPYGWIPTQVCRKCGAWRTLFKGMPSDWVTDRTLEEANRED